MAKRILIVDDESQVVALAGEILSSEGYEVDGASNGIEGIEKATAAPPDLILLDVNMPQMDGWEVLRALRADDNTKDVPVAIFTVRTDTRDKIYSLQKGAFDYITKPFTVSELTERVRRIFHLLEEGEPPTGSVEGLEAADE
jgi:DNA-binding response OmpR family regulator